MVYGHILISSARRWLVQHFFLFIVCLFVLRSNHSPGSSLIS
uniref:Uncharacterized protein n=1 Tax=Anguilla anguilla TaxID=7936 RepID=A0A0E9XME2_ANGAN